MSIVFFLLLSVLSSRERDFLPKVCFFSALQACTLDSDFAFLHPPRISKKYIIFSRTYITCSAFSGLPFREFFDLRERYSHSRKIPISSLLGGYCSERYEPLPSTRLESSHQPNSVRDAGLNRN